MPANMPETNPGKERTLGVNWTPTDYSVARLAVQEGVIDVGEFLGLPQMRISKITKGEILQFCQGCDLLGSDGVCTLGLEDQVRYAARESCGWASEDGVRGQMTSKGFTPFNF